MTPEEFVSGLQKVKRTGSNRWVACCPNHNDKSPSLSIGSSPQGKILLHCFAGCSALDVVHSMGLTLDDLFPDSYSENPHDSNRRSIKRLSDQRQEIQSKIEWYAIAIAQSERGHALTASERHKLTEIGEYLEKNGLMWRVAELLPARG